MKHRLSAGIFVSHIFSPSWENLQKRGDSMKQEEKKAPTWEVTDPKPPVVQSGHMENRRANKEIM